MYKSECCVHFLIHHQIFCSNAEFFQRFFQSQAKLVFADFADKGCFFAQIVQHGKHIAWCSAGICLKKPVALFAESVLGKINQQFAQCNNIICLHGITS